MLIFVSLDLSRLLVLYFFFGTCSLLLLLSTTNYSSNNVRDKNTVVRIQDKGSRFVLLTNEDYENKVEHQIARSSFKELPSDPSKEFERKIKLWRSGSQISL